MYTHPTSIHHVASEHPRVKVKQRERDSWWASVARLVRAPTKPSLRHARVILMRKVGA